jgi:hypothetical protein
VRRCGAVRPGSGAKPRDEPASHAILRPYGAGANAACFPWLAPWAIVFHPFGVENRCGSRRD